MARHGFIHDKLDIKFLVLYILSRAAAPLDLPTLTDLTMTDEGVDYFDFAEALSELIASDHLLLQDGLYTITDKGRKNGAACESSLPYSVRTKCDRRLSGINASLRRSSQIRSDILPREDGTCTLRLHLDDETGNLLTIELLSPSQAQAATLAEAFKAQPEEIYHSVLDALLRVAASRNPKKQEGPIT